MRKLPVDYVLTTFSISMFGPKASIHQQEVSIEVAKCLLGVGTQIIATRPSHENMAKHLFGDLKVARFADMAPEKSAIVIHYRGAPIDDSGKIPDGSTVTLYLVESEEYQELEE